MGRTPLRSMIAAAFCLRVRSLLLLLLPTLGWVVGCHSMNFLSRDNKNEERSERSEQHASGPPLPSKYSFRIHPYVFISDFPINEQQPIFKELALLREQVYKELMLPGGSTLVQVYLFENRERYQEYIEYKQPRLPPRRAYFIAEPRGMSGAEDLLVYTYRNDRIRQDLRHELTHALLHTVIRNVPLWLDEGLAEYFELPPDKHGVNDGHLAHLRHAYNEAIRPDLARLERLEQVDQMNPAEYRESWAWVHLMLRSQPEAKQALVAYLQQLRNHHSQTNFPPLRPQLTKLFPNLEDALVTHVNSLPAVPQFEARAVAGSDPRRP
jgi:Protein of unknown function (DUF1570)